jgi:hypothetical protein
MSATATKAIVKAIEQVDRAVEKIINDGDQYFPVAANIGDAVRQGDVYIQLINNVVAVPDFYYRDMTPNFPLQLAPGNTKGSRHMLEASDNAEVYICRMAELFEDENDGFLPERFEKQEKIRKELADYAMKITGQPLEEANKWRSESSRVADELMAALSLCGPIFVLKNPGCVSHPEHGNWILPSGSYRITFQRTLDRDMRVRRVFD